MRPRRAVKLEEAHQPPTESEMYFRSDGGLSVKIVIQYKNIIFEYKQLLFK